MSKQEGFLYSFSKKLKKKEKEVEEEENVEVDAKPKKWLKTNKEDRVFFRFWQETKGKLNKKKEHSSKKEADDRKEGKEGTLRVEELLREMNEKNMNQKDESVCDVTQTEIPTTPSQDSKTKLTPPSVPTIQEESEPTTNLETVTETVTKTVMTNPEETVGNCETVTSEMKRVKPSSVPRAFPPAMKVASHATNTQTEHQTVECQAAFKPLMTSTHFVVQIPAGSDVTDDVTDVATSPVQWSETESETACTVSLPDLDQPSRDQPPRLSKRSFNRSFDRHISSKVAVVNSRMSEPAGNVDFYEDFLKYQEKQRDITNWHVRHGPASRGSGPGAGAALTFCDI
eukprot:Platyproteum_vivax@DN2538_c0_g1_i10.p1